MATADILIVSQNDSDCRDVQDVFPAGGCRFEACSSISEAVSLVSKSAFSAVFLDSGLLEGREGDPLWAWLEANEQRPSLILMGQVSEGTVLPLPFGKYVFAVITRPLPQDFLRWAGGQAVKMWGMAQQIKDLKHQLADAGLKDPETGLYNHRYLQERLSSEFKRASRYTFPLSVVFVEAEFPGEMPPEDPAGHKILGDVARFLLHFCRENDIVIRCAEAKFFMILPDTIKKGALVFARRLVDASEKKFPEAGGGAASGIRVSLGVANYPADGVKDESGLLDLADRALKGAKKIKGNGFFAFKGIAREDILSIVTRKRIG